MLLISLSLILYFQRRALSAFLPFYPDTSLSPIRYSYCIFYFPTLDVIYGLSVVEKKELGVRTHT